MRSRPTRFVADLIQGHNVLWRGDCLDVVAWREDVPAPFPEYADIVQHLASHVLNRTEGKRLLIVDAAVKHERVAEVAFQPFPLHAPTSPLNGIKDLHTKTNEIRNRFPYRAIIRFMPGHRNVRI